MKNIKQILTNLILLNIVTPILCMCQINCCGKIADYFETNATESLYSISWNGKSKNGKDVSNGVYYAILRINGKIQKAKKITIIK